ncbi:hypothetical protein D9M72_476960 [compost metagenome]
MANLHPKHEHRRNDRVNQQVQHQATGQKMARFRLRRHGRIADHVLVDDDAKGVDEIGGRRRHHDEEDQHRLHHIFDGSGRKPSKGQEADCRAEGHKRHDGIVEIGKRVRPEGIVGGDKQIGADDRAQSDATDLWPANSRKNQSGRLQRRLHDHLRWSIQARAFSRSGDRNTATC